MLLYRNIPFVLSLCAVVPIGSFIPLVPAPTILVAVITPVTVISSTNKFFHLSALEPKSYELSVSGKNC